VKKPVFKVYLTALILFSSLFFSCGDDTVYVGISASGVPVSMLGDILKQHPLPEGFRAADNKTEGTEYSISLESRFTTLNEISGGRTAGQLPESVIISGEWYAPAAGLLDFGTDTDKTVYGEEDFVPLNSISLPEKALPVNGLFPGDPDYPGLRITELKISPEGKSGKDKDMILSQWLESLPSFLPEKKEDRPVITWIGAAGDIMVQRGVENILLSGKKGIDRVFSDTLPVLREQDLMLGNLEGSITLSWSKTPKSYNFKFRPEVLPVLHRAGFDYLSLTNNHIYDYGKRGFTDSIKYMKASPVATSGAGMNIAEAQKYWETRAGRVKVRVLSVGAYPRENNGFDGRTQASVTSSRPGILFAGPLADEAVRNMVSPDTFDIVFVHGGREWTYKPTEEQKKLYRGYIDMGADLVIGSHPHVLQGIEARNGGLIAYSMGNFIFPGMESMAHAEESLILSVGVFEGSIRYVILHPVRISGRTISLDKSPESVKRIVYLSRNLN